MNIKNLDNICMNCFSPLPAGAAFCTVCGHDQKSPPEAEYRLPLRTILNGKYMVGQVLGEGGFGITYVGYDLNLDIKVAVKEYYPSGFVTRTATSSSTVQTYGGEQGEIFRRGRERFVDEARRLARFRTLRGIVMVNDFFVENGTAYIVMEFVEGVTLKSYMAQQGGKLPAAQVLDMLGPVFESLSQIHEGGLIHRDISPDNIMITPDGSMKLLDFGAAREFGIDEKSLSVMLKHGYAPMEQYSTRGQQGPHTDVYALCATIYKAITGVTPESAMDRVIEDVVQPPRLLGVSIAPHQEAALMKGLAVRAENRWQTVGELQAALRIENGERRIENVGAAPAPAPHAPSSPNSQLSTLNSQLPPPSPNSQFSTLNSQLPKTPAKSKKPKIIAAVVAACIVVVGIVLALTLPGGGGVQIEGDGTPTGNISGGGDNTPSVSTPTDNNGSTTPDPISGDTYSDIPDEIVAEFAEREGYMLAKHILITFPSVEYGYSEKDVEEEKIEAYEKIEGILAELNEHKDEDAFFDLFDELITAHSEDRGSFEFPDGYLFQHYDMVPEFSDACEKLEIGQMSGIVETNYGYHIILRLPINYDLVPIALYNAGQYYTLRQLATDDNATATAAPATVEVDGVTVRLGTFKNEEYGEYFTLKADGTFEGYGNFGRGFETVHGDWVTFHHEDMGEDHIGLVENKNYYGWVGDEWTGGIYAWLYINPSNPNVLYTIDGGFGVTPVEEPFYLVG